MSDRASSSNKRVPPTAASAAAPAPPVPPAPPAPAPAPAVPPPKRGPPAAEAKRAAREEQAAASDAEDAETTSCASAKSTARSLGTNSSIASSSIVGRIPARQREAERIQQEMKRFVREMVRGRQMGVVSPDGQMRTCNCSLDRRLRNLVLELRGSARRIPLTNVREVYQGKEPEDIETPLDDLCATLAMEEGDCITFHFADIPARENFAMCLQLLVDGQQQ